MKHWITIGIFFSLFFIVTQSEAADYRVQYVQDGDTFVATDGTIRFRVRIMGIDAPEYGQRYANQSKARLKSLIRGRVVTLQTERDSLDRFGRVLAHVYLDQVNIGAKLIREGLAHYYRPTCQDYPRDKKRYNFDPSLYVKAEIEARESRNGFWKNGIPQKACEFRRLKR